MPLSNSYNLKSPRPPTAPSLITDSDERLPDIIILWQYRPDMITQNKKAIMS